MKRTTPLDPDNNLWDAVAHELRVRRKSLHLSIEDVGRIISRDRSLVARIEVGETKMQEDHAIALDAAWKTGGIFQRIVRWAKLRHNSEWGAERDKLENIADVMRFWALSWVPSLLQTPEYARAVFVGVGVSDVERHVEKRLKRQELLNRPVTARFMIDRGALLQPVGGPDVHRAQLAHLLELTDRYPVRVVPESAGSHPGRDGSFSLYTSGGVEAAMYDGLGPGRLVQDPPEARSYSAWWEQIGDVALPRDASKRLIRQIMEGTR